MTCTQSSLFLPPVHCRQLWRSRSENKVKKGKERDELVPPAGANLRRALKVRSLCQRGDFRRGLTCQEVSDRETVSCTTMRGASAVGTGQCVCRSCVPWPTEHPFGKDLSCGRRTLVGFRLCASARLIYYFLWWPRVGKGGYRQSEGNVLFYIWYIILLLIDITCLLSL